MRYHHQASSTPLGHGEGYHLFHGPEQHEAAKAVLSGTLDWEYPMAEVNEYIDNLSLAYDKEKIKKEEKVINAIIMEGKFWHYFQHKKKVRSPPLQDSMLDIIRQSWEMIIWLVSLWPC